MFCHYSDSIDTNETVTNRRLGSDYYAESVKPGVGLFPIANGNYSEK